MVMLVPQSSATRSLNGSRTTNTTEKDSYLSASVALLNLFAKLFSLLLLVGLLLAAGVVWVWLAGFRGGSRFGGWVYKFWGTKPEEQDKLTLGLIYSLIVKLFLPLVLFSNWAKQIIGNSLPNPFKPPTDLKKIVEDDLAIKFPKDDTGLPETPPALVQGKSGS